MSAPASTSLLGQATPEAKAAVGNQREIKRLKEQLRKLEAKAKKAAPQDAEAAAAEVAKCKEELRVAEGADASTSVPVSSSPAVASSSSAAPTSAPTSNVVVPKVVQPARKPLSVSGLWTSFGNMTTQEHAIHPRFAELALRVKRLQLVGGTCRTHAFISAAKVLLMDLFDEHAEEREDSENRFFETIRGQFRSNYEHLGRARPHCAGILFAMGEIVSFLHPPSDGQKKSLNIREVTAMLDGLAESIDSANDITDHTRDLIKADDVILVYGRSAAVEKLLVAAVKDDDRAPSKIIVVDGGPLHEGRVLTQRLRKLGVEVDYCTLSGLCQMMPMCTRVFIGASLVMQSGDVLNRCGTAMVAAVASQFKVPVVCLCESYKFQPSFWLGSMTSNATVRSEGPLTRAPGTLFDSTSVFPDTEREGNGLVSTVGFVYDVTPARFIDLIVHKGGRMHPSAAINKVKENEKLKTMLPY